MRLKHLSLQGFKTFAPRTDLPLGEGITAIVGPNGSGKSNVADAVRWVLGEQSLLQLRAKRTEDLIFAGSGTSRPLGMAEVSLTVDNSDRLLPLDFAEVTLTRRAYRSGENEYYINKSRVRLRDVLEVASTLGQAYTVVSQGLVDSALSLRPEERRELFEEAAAIRGYFVQREDALRRLGRTEENMARVGDLAAELEPQVRRLERQARQAQEYGKIEAEWREAQRQLYTARLLIASGQLTSARAEEQAAGKQVASLKAGVEASSLRLTEARRVVWELVDSVSEMHELRAQLQARHAAQSQSHAVLAERLVAARAQTAGIEQERSALLTAQEAVQRRLAEAEEEMSLKQEEIALLREAGRDEEKRLADHDVRLNELTERHKGRAGLLESVQRKAADLESRMSHAQRRIAEQSSVAQEAESALSQLNRKLQAEEAARDERHDLFLAARQAVAASEAEAAQAQSALSKRRAAQLSVEAGRRELQRRLDSLNSQLTALAGEQSANLFGGVRSVMTAAREGKLEGVVGTVAELLQVPPDLEIAVEAALGGRLQDVVVERWSHAERAISMLKTHAAGRATFLPLDTLRASPASNPPRGQGIRGLARDLVEYSPQLGVLAESLLGRLLVVDDLPAARRALSSMPAGAPWTLATLDGEVVRPGGSVAGGSNTRADDNRARGRTILARERKRRELTASAEGLKRELVEADELLTQALDEVRQSENQLAKLAAGAEEARKKQVAAQMAHVEQQSVTARLQQEISWRTGLLGETRRTIDSQQSLLESTSAEFAQLAAQVEPLAGEVAALRSDIEAATAEREAAAGSAGAGRTRLAVLAEALRNVQARRDELAREAKRHEVRLADLQARLGTGAEAQALLGRQVEEQAELVGQLAGRLAEVEAQVGPAEHKVRVLEVDVNRAEVEHSAVQAALLDGETALSHADVAVQRCIGTLNSLRVEIIEELGDTAEPPEHGAGEHPAAPPPVLPLTTSEAAAPLSEQELAALERTGMALKARLSRLGPVNPLAMEEHASLAERHTYLHTQLSDLSAAAGSLRQAISELDRVMREQFTATFEQVNEKFQHFFSLLFAGGQAKLELTDPQDAGASGVEITAQPPGKRMQTLAALSGGERALTSAALLFALLKVRPVPFCVLDEVDAALDESNVTRFRSALQELGEKTQFVVITHNRGTIESANTLYGVSMAGDGTSQLLSLKMDSERQLTEQGRRTA